MAFFFSLNQVSLDNGPCADGETFLIFAQISSKRLRKLQTGKKKSNKENDKEMFSLGFFPCHAKNGISSQSGPCTSFWFVKGGQFLFGLSYQRLVEFKYLVQ